MTITRFEHGKRYQDADVGVPFTIVYEGAIIGSRGQHVMRWFDDTDEEVSGFLLFVRHIEVPDLPPDWWINVDVDGQADVYLSMDFANANAHPDRIWLGHLRTGRWVPCDGRTVKQ